LGQHPAELRVACRRTEAAHVRVMLPLRHGGCLDLLVVDNVRVSALVRHDQVFSAPSACRDTEKPMRTRALSPWLPCASMMLVSLISYIDRNTLALLSPTILHDTGLNGEQYGWIISAFSIAYMIGNPLWGRALDRVGVFAGMLVAVALWSV